MTASIHPTRILYLAMLPAIAAAGPAKIAPQREGDALVLYDAARHGLGHTRNYTAGWRKGSDLTPQARLVERGGAPFAEFSFEGRQGLACSTTYFAAIPPPADGMRYDGLAVTAGYDRDDFGKLGLTAHFSDGTQTSYTVTLEQGTKEYPLAGGFRRAKAPIDWEKLDYVMLTADASGKGNPLRYWLKRIIMKQAEKAQRARLLHAGNVKRAHEILPIRDDITLDAARTEKTWSACRPLESLYYHGGPEVPARESPYAVRIAYDARNLYIATESTFPTPPLARIRQADGPVFQDEAQEFFFRSRAEHTLQIQWVVNAQGAIFDAVNGDRGQGLHHEKRMAYAGGKWTGEFAFPLYDLNVDPGKQRHMEFQIAQSYRDRKEKGLRTVVWSRTGRFPDAGNFGLLVFNKQPFGPGEIAVKEIRRIDGEDKTSDFHIDCALTGFTPGTYRAQWTIQGATEQVEEERVAVPAGGELHRMFRMGPADNRNSTYTFYLTLLNARDDARVFAVNFKNWADVGDLFAERLFNPRPKKLTWKKGELAVGEQGALFLPATASARTRRTAALFAEQLYGYTGRRLATESYSGPLPPHGLVLRLAPAAEFDGKETPLQREGYRLTVEPGRAVITGADEPGLYYGTVTFLQLLKQPMTRTERMPVPCVDILDWPDLPHRLCRLEHASTFRNSPVHDRWGIDYLMEWTDRFVAGNKMNVLMIDLSANVTYKRRTEMNGSEKLYSLEDLARFGEFCRDRFVDLMPAWQIGGHAAWWMLVGYHPEMREKGWSSQADITHPGHDPLMLDCMLDVIEALKPKYLTPKSDEWWHNRKSGETPDELLNGKTRAQAFLDLHVNLHRWLKERGITLAMYHDMLTPYHNGKRYDVYTIIDRFPKDVIMLAWSPRHVKYFAERGFPVWVNPTGMFLASDEEKPLIQGYGKGMYSWGNYKHGLKDEYNSLTSAYCMFHGADYAWSLMHDSGESTTRQIESGRLVALRQMFAVHPNPVAGTSFAPLDLSGAMTHAFETFLHEVKPDDYPEGVTPVELPAGTQEIGLIPMQLAGSGRHNCIILREKDAPVELTLGKRFASLVFLHAAYINDPRDKRAQGVKRRSWPYGWPLGDYIVHYADGAEEKLPLRLTMNIKRFDTASLNRATLENRYVWALKDHNRNDVHLFQWEWVNPHPEKEIAKVVARHANKLDVSLVLFAMTGREVRLER
ncbi:MAG: hypothetical protein JXR37_05500 [Kiritimatiellae bacterium]|nr:hypothetical protein [Kiritimatiellia bacterium]